MIVLTAFYSINPDNGESVVDIRRWLYDTKLISIDPRGENLTDNISDPELYSVFARGLKDSFKCTRYHLVKQTLLTEYRYQYWDFYDIIDEIVEW